MHSKNNKLQIDRIEEGVAVAFDDSGNKYTLHTVDASLNEGDIINAMLDENDSIVSYEVLTEETTFKRNSLLNRLRNLFKNQGD